MIFSKHSRKMNSKKVTGQGMSEYLIIVGLLAVAGIAVMGLMGGTVRNQFGGMAQELAGNNGSAQIVAASGRATAAASTANTQRTLSNYGNQASAIAN